MKIQEDSVVFYCEKSKFGQMKMVDFTEKMDRLLFILVVVRNGI